MKLIKRVLLLALIGLLCSQSYAQVGSHQSGNSIVASSAAVGSPGNAVSTLKRGPAETFLSAPLSFERNQGQADPKARFVSRGNGYSLALTDSAAVLTLHRTEKLSTRPGIARIFERGRRRRLARSNSLETDVVRMELAGAKPVPSISGSDPLTGTTNYFIGKDPSKWLTKVPTYASVRYSGIYRGVDLLYYGNQRQLEYDFIVAPHSDPKQIKLHFSGAQGLKLDGAGNLEVIADDGEVVFQKPTIYQEKDGRRVPVNGRFMLLADETVGFKVSGYDRGKPLVIDPTLSYSTYLGGSTDDAGTAITVDAAGNIYVIGFTVDTDFPVTAGSFQTTNTANTEVAFVAKLNAAGSALVYATYLGGTASPNGTNLEDNEAYGIAVDTAGDAYICGEVYSNTFPVTAGAFQTQNNAFTHNAENAFISELNPDGTALVYSTYLGGSGLAISTEFYEGDSPLRMTVDAAGDAYIVGTAYSTDFPTSDEPYQTTNNAAANLASNAFVTELNPTGTGLVYSTYLGGSGVNPSSLPNGQEEGLGDEGYGIAVDGNDNAYVTGYTFSADFPGTAPYGYQQVNHGTANFAANAFVSKFNAEGALTASTYLGGTGLNLRNGNSDLDSSDNGDNGIGIALDGGGNAYVVGVTASTDFPTTDGAYQTTNKAAANLAANAFVSKLNATLSTLTYSTYVGGSGVASADSGVTGGGDFGTGIAVDAAGDAYITGATESTNFPVTGDAFQTGPRSTRVVDSGFFTEVNPTGSALLYSTYLGGSGAGSYGGTESSFFEGDFFYDIALDTANNIYLTGYAYSYDFPVTQNALQRVNNAGGVPGGNAFITKFGATAGATYLPTTTTLSSTTAGANITFSALVKPVTGTGIPTGTVNFYVNSAKEMTVTLDPTGTATYTTDQLTDSLNNVIAAYSGDATYGASGSSLGQTPGTPGGTSTSTTVALAIGPTPVAYGTPVTLTATVSSSAGAVSPGLVVFCTASAAVCNEQFNLGSAQLTAAGTASISLYPGAVGVHSYVAVFIGTSTAATATSPPGSVTVTGTYPTTTTLSASGSTGSYTLTSTVAGQGVTSLTPTGSVSFLDVTNNNAVIGTAPLGTGTAVQTLAASAASPLAVGSQPYAVATGDFNGDGFTDFAVENYGSATVSVVLGNGDGTFKAQVTYAVGNDPEGIAAADVNGDGKLDLLVTNTADGTIGVLIGNGDGTFQPQVTYPVVYGSAGIVVADFNHDGKLDIATSNFYSANISVLLGNGDGTFQEQVNYAVGNEPRTLSSGDFNGDGNIDLAVANQEDNTASILLGNGDGTFQPQVTYSTGTAPQGVAVADFNSDGKLDLAIGNSGDNTVGILLGNGDGTFQVMTTYATGNTPLGVVTADFNGDGKIDVAVENYVDNTESLLLGNGDGTLQTQSVFPTGTTPYAAAVGDFNGDGYPDLAISNFGSNNETILLDQLTSTTTAVLTPVVLTGAAGNHSVVASYPGDSNFTTSTSPAVTLVSLGVSAPTIVSLAPNSAVAGSSSVTVTISGTQFLSGAAVKVNGTSQAATFVSATQLTTTLTAAELSTAGTLTLTVVNPDGGTSNAAAFTISAVGTSVLILNSITPAGAQAGAGATTITAAGANFTPTAVVNFNTTPLATTFVSATQLTAVVPAALITTAGTANITVTDPASGSTSQVSVFTILPGTPGVTFSAPPASPEPAQQPTLNFQLTQAYPVALTGTITLTFTPDTGNPDNPQVQLASTTTGVTLTPDGRTLTFPLAANSTTTPVVMVQIGNVSGTINITLQLTAAGVNVTPANVVPVTIVVPRVAPTISALSFTTSGNTLTVLVTGFSTTREIQSATFTFTAASGASLSEKTLNVPATTLFTTWYTTADSVQYGSAFTYSQIFTLSGNANAVAGVGATLTNTIGTSTEATAP